VERRCHSLIIRDVLLFEEGEGEGVVKYCCYSFDVSVIICCEYIYA
jgi:hypothetical protein